MSENSKVATTKFDSVSGVYIIECTGNDKLYVGSATNLKRRRTTHLWALRAKRNACLKLQRAFDKYGEKSLKFYLLELAEPQNLRQLERYWIDALDTIDRGLNISPDTGAPMLGRHHTTETRAKMSAANKGTRNPMFGTPSPNLGKSCSKLTRKRISQALTGRKVTGQALVDLRIRAKANRGRKWSEAEHLIHGTRLTGAAYLEQDRELHRILRLAGLVRRKTGTNHAK